MPQIVKQHVYLENGDRTGRISAESVIHTASSAKMTLRLDALDVTVHHSKYLPLYVQTCAQTVLMEKLPQENVKHVLADV